MELTHYERIIRLIAGEKIDRPPIAFWQHFPVDDQEPDTLAAATIHFQNTYDLDIVKVTPSSSFCIRDYGVHDKWEGNPEGTREYTNRIIHEPEDWLSLKPANPRKGCLEKQLDALALITRYYKNETLVLQTVFNPLAQAKNLAGKDVLKKHLREYPDAVHEGLRSLTLSTMRLIEEVEKMGADGVFYAVQHAQNQLMTNEEYNGFGLQYDDQIIDLMGGFSVNMLHLHGVDVKFNLFREKGFDIINWHDREENPSLKIGKEMYDGIVCGGLKQWETMVYSTPSHIRKEAQKAFDETEGERFILGTGCVLPVITPHGNISCARRIVDSWRE